MSRLILLELTEEEIVTVLRFAENGWLNASFDIMSGEEQRRLSKVLTSVKDKAVEAVKVQLPVTITFKDLFDIICSAKDNYNSLHHDLHLSDKKVEQKDFVHISIANSVISWLNKNRLLKKEVSFDITDASCKFEETVD